ncbi:thiol peroxidase [Desulforhopalus singaporensis]|uniref:Thiol peroxidase, atypical 2-Cys peroxiredoxin n=1 Tax=Desulforhopalus singaporensis TaxID=91360 RepID=A0A1H0MFX7_9BACT|nr:redoxin family protein [Desulforhopalus singaporensis]SDO79319.1 thiol peroxidase, atypical 2-Cys peroxiredoxin [Desulforhopalus singaporensis]
MKHIIFILATISLALAVSSCGVKQSGVTVDSHSVLPGTEVVRKGKSMTLLGNRIETGQRIPATELIDAATMDRVNLEDYAGNVLFLSIVPSIDTKVCEEQTHLLGERGDMLPADVKRITVSRDTPFAQTRFAVDANLTDIQYLSDYKEGSFGLSTGLLVDDLRLLARAVIVIDKDGIVRYIQVVPDIGHLPDMERAFSTARELDAEK